jgi:hypothetical protein
MTIEDLIEILKAGGKKMPKGLKTSIFAIEVNNLRNAGHSICPEKSEPEIYFYKDSLGDITLHLRGI